MGAALQVRGINTPLYYSYCPQVLKEKILFKIYWPYSILYLVPKLLFYFLLSVVVRL